MDILENDKHIKLNSTIEQDGAYKLRLQDRDFIFWLTVFHKVMPHVEIIFKQLQTINSDPIKAKQDLKNFENAMQKIRIRKIRLQLPGLFRLVLCAGFVTVSQRHFRNSTVN
ncbi:unnamed protein product [Psylliodes chrysocephalus]|uniref:Uncharacterized protein n=1 Tax=Psylliodes chrysocephalus TaxID=3402493 RepID=A0A9P0D5G6_9CUCU|nr:unnamed protein product [Psylliodes chrysocephala]